MTLPGSVEILSTDFAIGWARTEPAVPNVVYATLADRVIGYAEANLVRRDLQQAAASGGVPRAGYTIVFNQPVVPERVDSIEVHTLERSTLPRSAGLKLDRTPKIQIFIFGSPRSGTSELGRTLSQTLGLPWLGEGHAAPLFSAAAEALGGNKGDRNGLVRHLAEQNVRNVAIEAARRAYYFMHSSASFLDKTPGIPMIRAASFLHECFPDAKMICLRRNGISNVLSRMAKFGGNFEANCSDWAGAINEWVRIRDVLPSYLELKQEDMAEVPDLVAGELAEYLAVQDEQANLTLSLQQGAMETTGAGRDRDRLDQTGWTEAQIGLFKKVCGEAMGRAGYDVR